MKIIRNIIEQYGSSAYGKLKKQNLLPIILKLTSFLDRFYDNISWSQRFWHIKNNNFDIQLCICDKPTRYTKKNSKYAKTCSMKCKVEMNKKMFIEKYGVDNPSKRQEFKENLKKI